MIIEAFCVIIRELMQFLLGWITLPGMPETAKNALDTYFGYIFDNLDFLNFFLNVGTLKAVAAIAIILFSFEHMYKISIWIIHKLPLSID